MHRARTAHPTASPSNWGAAQSAQALFFRLQLYKHKETDSATIAFIRILLLPSQKANEERKHMLTPPRPQALLFRRSELLRACLLLQRPSLLTLFQERSYFFVPQADYAPTELMFLLSKTCSGHHLIYRYSSVGLGFWPEGYFLGALYLKCH